MRRTSRKFFPDEKSFQERREVFPGAGLFAPRRKTRGEPYYYG
jgi:hypothetical protein